MPNAPQLYREINAGDPGELEECIQTLMEVMFSNSVTRAYNTPAAFWDTPPGQMFARAIAWLHADDLITISEAAQILGIATQTVSHKVAEGSLVAYPDPAEKNPQRRNRVLRSDVERLKK